MKLLKISKRRFTLVLINIYSTNAYSKGVGQGLTSLNDSIKNDIGLASVILAITIAGLYIAFGKKEGNEKFGSAVTGALVIAFAASIGGIIWTAAR
jgi:type IV secretory pathway VirB2 component (pilin)